VSEAGSQAAILRQLTFVQGLGGMGLLLATSLLLTFGSNAAPLHELVCMGHLGCHHPVWTSYSRRTRVN